MTESAQDEKSAAAKLSVRRRGLGAGGAKKRMRILQQETTRLQQVRGLDAFLCESSY